jgi:hypothetical protein
MDLRLSDRHTLSPGKFYAIAAPVKTMLAGLNSSPALGRYTTLFISGNFSRILDGITRPTDNLNVRRAFTAHQLLTVLRESSESIILCEHDSSLYDDAGEVKRVIPGTMKEVSRDAIFLLYSPFMDKHFSYLASACDHLIVYEECSTPAYSQGPKRNAQKTLF